MPNSEGHTTLHVVQGHLALPSWRGSLPPLDGGWWTWRRSRFLDVSIQAWLYEIQSIDWKSPISERERERHSETDVAPGENEFDTPDLESS